MRNPARETHMIAQASLERRGQSSTVTRHAQVIPTYQHVHWTLLLSLIWTSNCCAVGAL